LDIQKRAYEPSHSAQQQGFDLAMQNDWLFLNYTNFATRTLRLPCALTPYIGPLVNIVDPITGNQFCSGGVLASGEGIWAGKTNSYILKYIVDYGRPTGQYELDDQTNTLTVGVNPGVTANPGWREWFAQALAIEASSDIGGTSNLPEIDQAVSNGCCVAALRERVGQALAVLLSPRVGSTMSTAVKRDRCRPVALLLFRQVGRKFSSVL